MNIRLEDLPIDAYDEYDLPVHFGGGGDTPAWVGRIALLYYLNGELKQGKKFLYLSVLTLMEHSDPDGYYYRHPRSKDHLWTRDQGSLILMACDWYGLKVLKNVIIKDNMKWGGLIYPAFDFFAPHHIVSKWPLIGGALCWLQAKLRKVSWKFKPIGANGRENVSSDMNFEMVLRMMKKLNNPWAKIIKKFYDPWVNGPNDFSAINAYLVKYVDNKSPLSRWFYWELLEQRIKDYDNGV